MNKRKKKKLAKKQELFVINFANSYREVKERRTDLTMSLY